MTEKEGDIVFSVYYFVTPRIGMRRRSRSIEEEPIQDFYLDSPGSDDASTMPFSVLNLNTMSFYTHKTQIFKEKPDHQKITAYTFNFLSGIWGMK